MIQDHVRELETLLARKRRSGSVLLNIDMWDRWGSAQASDEERARYAAEADAALRERSAAVQGLDSLVARLRVEAPDAIVAWADAHDAFLAAFIEGCPDAPGSHASTARFVAAQERVAWAEVRRGERAWVDENVYFIAIDPDRYRALFGIDP
jgi:hypothetical protein